MIIDTHCHLNYLNDIEGSISRANDNLVEKIVLPSVEMSEFEEVVSVADSYSHVYFAIGVHPNCVEEYSDSELIKYISHDKCVAVGECGLDYYRLPDNIEDKKRVINRQKDVLLSQIKLANKYHKPIIIHSRSCSDDLVKILQNNPLEQGGIIHCYDGDKKLSVLLDMGFYFSYSGIVTFKNSNTKDSLEFIPLDRILVETDAPYLAPVPYRGKSNEPSYIKSTIDFIADYLGYNDRTKFYDIVKSNTENIFNFNR